jgi:hypothetical protein
MAGKGGPYRMIEGLPMKKNHRGKIIGARSLGQDHWGKTIGAKPLGQNHWGKTIGARPLGQNHWGKIIGARPLGQDHWGKIIGARSLGQDHWGRMIGAGSLGPKAGMSQWFRSKAPETRTSRGTACCDRILPAKELCAAACSFSAPGGIFGGRGMGGANRICA